MRRLSTAGLSARLARALAVMATCAAMGACDDPAQLAREITDAQGDCTQDSLRVTSEACVDMFEKYAEMATGVMHTYIGGLKAMDQALKRLPPPNFDTAGLGRAFTYAPDSLAVDSTGWRGERFLSDPNDLYRSDPTGRYSVPDPRVWDAPGSGDPTYTDGSSGDPDGRFGSTVRRFAPPITRPGVLLPPEERLRRPWIEEDAPEPTPSGEEYADPNRYR